MTSDNNLSDNTITPGAKKAWSAPYFEIISRDKIKGGNIPYGLVEGSKSGPNPTWPHGPYKTTSYQS